MATKTKRKRKAKPPRYADEKHRNRVLSVMRKYDFQAWEEGWDIPRLREKVAKESGLAITPRAFKVLRAECTLFRTVTRPMCPKTPLVLLDAGQWSRIKRAILELRPLLYNRTLDEAVAIVRTRCACSAELLRNMTSDARPWEQGPPVPQDEVQP